jgi:hypothetical protein
VVVAAVDWGVDIDSAAFRWPGDRAEDGRRTAGATRLLALWDQRDRAIGPRPDPYGYGSVHDKAEIDRALRDPRPYERLGYHPAIADPLGRGSHGTRTMDIAAGNGEANGPAGIAPDADLIFVHLADRNTGGLANFGDSVRLLEAVDFICRTAGPQPCVINISAGRLCGPRDGTTLVERAFDQLLAAMPGRFIVDSAGNYFRWRAHSCGTIATGETLSLTVVIHPADITLSEVEIWYDGNDEFAVRVDPPGYAAGRPVRLGERSDILIGGRVAGRVYHREHDPNNGANHIVAYLDPIGCAGNWTITLEGRRVSNGRFHAWIERDDTCRHCQARFAPGDSNPASTIGSIATSHLPLVLFAALRAGADGYLLKTMNLGRLRDALIGVHSGEAAIQRALVARVLNRFHGREPRWRRPVVGETPGRRMTSREWQVLELLVQQRSTAEIAEELVLSPGGYGCISPRSCASSRSPIAPPWWNSSAGHQPELRFPAKRSGT